MQIRHRITLSSDDRLWRAVDRLGLSIQRDGSLIGVLEITEDHPAWPEVARLLERRGIPSDQYSNVYSADELDAADWLRVGASGQHGYPQPEDGYFQQTYSPSGTCARCGIHGAQTSPFRLRAALPAKRSQFLQLNWVFDVLFVRDEVRRGLAEAGITGVTFSPVILHKNERPIAAVSQMEVDQILPPSLEVAALQPVTCVPDNEESRGSRDVRSDRGDSRPYCRRVKYHVRRRGPHVFSSRAFEEAPDVVRSHEWFGSGASAFRLILVSQAFRRMVVSNKWRGLHFEPVALSDGSA